MTLQLLSAMEKVHPQEPHYYLEFLGTRRDQQGHGIGSAVMAPMLDRCDEEGVPAYLESSNRQNVPFYARHGFVETGVISAPRNGPKLTAMWREPRTA
jgi:GNAT superfamily N-acetyltransferase